MSYQITNVQTLEEMSLGPGQYYLEDAQNRNKISYPFHVNLQKMGGSVVDSNFADIESDLNNLTRKLSKNPAQQYNLGDVNKSYSMIHFENGGPPEQVDTNITNSAFELKGVGFNRWEPLFFDPQKNCIEPFRRIGDNTVLNELDSYEKNCFQNNKFKLDQ